MTLKVSLNTAAYTKISHNSHSASAAALRFKGFPEPTKLKSMLITTSVFASSQSSLAAQASHVQYFYDKLESLKEVVARSDLADERVSDRALMAESTCEITCYHDYTGSALLHECSDKTTTSSDFVAKKDSSSADVHTKVAMLVKAEMSSRRYMTCSLLMVVLVCAHFGSTNAFNDTAVSQTYDNVHLTEAARKAQDGDSNLEDLLHWAIENSDPDQLKQQAEHVAADSVHLSERQREVQQVGPRLLLSQSQFPA